MANSRYEVLTHRIHGVGFLSALCRVCKKVAMGYRMQTVIYNARSIQFSLGGCLIRCDVAGCL